MEIVYLLVALFSTTVGAISGLGGGVIIKPVLDTIGQYDAATVSLLSSFTVLSMAVVSTFKQFKSGIRFDGKRTFFISSGSVIGGIAGKFLFSFIAGNIADPQYITAVQSLILALLLGLVLIYLLKKSRSSLHIHNRFIIISAGFLLGIAASFLGVGGGPFNVVLLTWLFSMDSRAAAVHSVLIILFSQSAKILSIAINPGFSGFDLSVLIFMIPGGIAGGILGSALNRFFRRKTIQFLFKVVVSVLIVLNLYNLFISMI